MPILDVELVSSEEPAEGLAQALADAGMRPVFVTVLQGSCPAPPDRRALARGLCAAVPRLTARPTENVHLLFEPEARGRIAFGGELRE